MFYISRSIPQRGFDIPTPIDPTSPIPLYHQIAQSIRAACDAGELLPGDALAPLRRAADEWGVNVHTVRHAYTALARQGVVRTTRGPSGSVVAAVPRTVSKPGAAADSWQTFLAGIIAAAQNRHAVGPEALSDAIRQFHASPRARVYLVECSRWQAECHANELRAEYFVEAVPWVLADGEPPDGVVVATFFHYNDIRKLWPRRLSAIRFVSVQPEPSVLKRLDGVSSVVVCEMDQETADAVAADLKGVVGPGRPVIRTKIAEDPNTLAPRRTKRSVPHYFAPRAWAELSDETRSNPNVCELRYAMDPTELATIADQSGWRRAAGLPTGRTG